MDLCMSCGNGRIFCTEYTEPEPADYDTAFLRFYGNGGWNSELLQKGKGVRETCLNFWFISV